MQTWFRISSLPPICSSSFSFMGVRLKKVKTKLGCQKYFLRVTYWAQLGRCTHRSWGLQEYNQERLGLVLSPEFDDRQLHYMSGVCDGPKEKNFRTSCWCRLRVRRRITSSYGCRQARSEDYIYCRSCSRSGSSSWILWPNIYECSDNLYLCEMQQEFLNIREFGSNIYFIW